MCDVGDQLTATVRVGTPQRVIPATFQVGMARRAMPATLQHGSTLPRLMLLIVFFKKEVVVMD
jgi:hypothetical protein